MMNNVPTDKYNVAWFKLAECISRGEKERALGVYRLLAHSLDDAPFSLQLQGDILLSFKDHKGAVESYYQAIESYRNGKRLLQAAAVAEHILALSDEAEKHKVLTLLIDLYSELRISDKVIAYAQTQCAFYLVQDEVEHALETMVRLDTLVESNEVMVLRQDLIVALIKHGALPMNLVLAQLHKMLDGLSIDNNKLALQQFMTLIEELSSDYYAQARTYLNRS